MGVMRRAVAANLAKRRPVRLDWYVLWRRRKIEFRAAGPAWPGSDWAGARIGAVVPRDRQSAGRGDGHADGHPVTPAFACISGLRVRGHDQRAERRLARGRTQHGARRSDGRHIRYLWDGDRGDAVGWA